MKEKVAYISSYAANIMTSKLEKGLDQDGRVEGLELTSPPQQLKNLPTCGTSLMELETDQSSPIQQRFEKDFHVTR